MNRKGYFGIVCLAMCDSQCRFTYFSANHAGSTHDAVAFNDSELIDILEKQLLPSEYFMISDEAFAIQDQFLTPWPGARLPSAHDSFNHHLSMMRQTIERSFGMLVRRWGVLWRPVMCAFEKWSLVVLVCAKLHNLCVDTHAQLPELTDDENSSADITLAFGMSNEARDQPHRSRSSTLKSACREALTQQLRRSGYTRPGRSAVIDSDGDG